VRDFELDDAGLTVRFTSGRKPRVSIQEEVDHYDLFAVVARRAQLAAVDHLPERLWRLNRATQLVSFKTDRHGRVVGTSWLPKAGLTPEEFQRAARRLAAESDRVELLLTGKDWE
jgi:hypothetical protein